MPYSLLDQLRLFSPRRFEELCGQLVGNEVAPDSWGHVEGSGGDEGIDIFSGVLDLDERRRQGVELRVWQVKHFFHGLKTAQRQKIKRSLIRVLEAHNPDAWILCLPVQLTIDEQAWFSALKQEIEAGWPGLRIEPPWLGEEIVRRAISCSGVVDAYFLRAPAFLADSLLADLAKRLDSFESVSDLLARTTNRGDAAAFYNGTVPDWGNIVAGHDARREVSGEIWDLIRERSNQDAGGRIPLVLIRGSAMDGKSTLLMRLAVELHRQDYHLVFYHKSGAALDADQFLALEIPENHIIFALIDGLMSIDLDEIQAFFERLHRHRAKVFVIATVLSSIWGASTATLENVAEVNEFDLASMTALDAEALLDKLGEDPAHAESYLGRLAHLSREAQLSLIRNKARGQLGVVLLEAKHNTLFEAYVLREFHVLSELHGSLVRRACIYVSAFHRFDVGMPITLLKRVLPQLHIEDDLLRVTRGFVKLASSGLPNLAMRHARWADVVFRHVAQNRSAEKSWLCEILERAQADGSEETACRQVLGSMSQRGSESLAYEILQSSEWTSVSLLHMLAGMQRKRGRFLEASRVLRRALEIGPESAQLLIALAQVEADRGNLGSFNEEYSARWLFRKAVELPGDPHPVYTWHAWAMAEAKGGAIGFRDASQLYTARWLFKKATEVEPQVPLPWAAWAQLEAERGNVGEVSKPGRRRQQSYCAREILRRATHQAGAHPSLWRQWAMLETKKHNLGYSFDDPYTVRWLYWQLLRVDPNNSVSWRAWAIVEGEAGNIGPYREDWSSAVLEGSFTARWMFWRGTIANTRDAGTWQAWGMLEMAQGNWGDQETPARYTARWLFRRATEVNPVMPHAWNGWAMLEEKDQRYEIAARLLERVGDVEAEPVLRAIAYFKAALAMKRAKAPAEHERLLQKVLEVDGDNLRAHVFLARLRSRQRRWPESEQHFRHVLTLDPANSLGQMWFAEMQAFREKEAGNWDASERCFLEAAGRSRAAKKKSRMLLEAALVARCSGRKGDEKRHLKAAIAADKSNAVASAQLARVRRESGVL